jgi:dsDNA-binding SOS-regulon protein
MENPDATAADGTATATQEPKAAPPYVPFKTVSSLIERMEKDGAIPSQIDKSYVTHVPWGSQNHLLAAFGWLGLTENGKPTERLEMMVNEPGTRAAVWQQILRERYPGPMGLAKNATQQQLESQFKNYNLSAETQRKALSFFLAAAKENGVELSPLFKPQKAPTGSRKPRVKAPKHEDQNDDQEHAPPPPPDDNAPALIRNLLAQLPPEGSEWDNAKAEVWLTIAKSTFQLVYRMTDTPSGASAATPSHPQSEGGESS